MPDDSEMGNSENAAEPWRPRPGLRNEPRGPDYRPFTAKFDEIVNAEELCDPEELERLRSIISTSSLRICRASWRASPTGCSAG